jgi:hypothetical protein
MSVYVRRFAMPYLNCPSCGLTLKVTGSADLIEHCPRCLARRRRLVDLFVSARPGGRRPAARDGGDADVEER